MSQLELETQILCLTTEIELNIEDYLYEEGGFSDTENVLSLLEEELKDESCY